MDENTPILFGLDDKMGNNTDPAGVLTVFQNFAKIVAAFGSDPGVGNGDLTAVMRGLRYLYDTLTGRVGTSTDGWNVASLFGKLANFGLETDAASPNGSGLARLANLVATNGQLTDAASSNGSILARLADMENKVGAINPTSGSMGNLFQFLWFVLNYLNGGAAIPGLGQQGDTASASGTANAKLAALLQRVGGGAVSVFAQPVSLGASQTTVLSVTGPGVLYSVDYQTGYSNFSAVIIADGRTIYSGNPFATLPNNYNFTPLFKGVLHFNSLLTITAAEGTAGGAAAFAITYATGVA